MDAKAVFPLIKAPTNNYIPIAGSANGALFVALQDSTGNAINGSLILDAPFDPTTTYGLPTLAVGYVWTGTELDRRAALLSNADGQSAAQTGLAGAVSRNQGYNGATWDRVRVPNVYKSVLVTATGDTTIWTPAAGKRFRLMGYSVQAAATIALAGIGLLKLLDGASATIEQHALFFGGTASAANWIGINSNLQNGYLSAVADNVLKVNLDVTPATGRISINVFGTEE
jgi:hypothetical protein